MSESEAKTSVEGDTGIRIADVEVPALVVGETAIVVQRHAKWVRSKDDPRHGHLVDGAAETVALQTRNRLGKMLAELTTEERQQLAIGVIASDTSAGTGQRCVETADAVLAEVTNFFNKAEGGHIEILSFGTSETTRKTRGLREPDMFLKHPEFVELLKNKAGEGKNFWIGYETDKYRDERVAAGAEGPWNLADRLKWQMSVLKRYSSAWHKEHPNRVLILWVITHYDLISPMLKRDKFSMDEKGLVLVDEGAGFVIHIRSNRTERQLVSSTTFDMQDKTGGQLTTSNVSIPMVSG